MGKQVISQCGGCSCCCLGCKVLGCQGTGQSNDCKEQKKTSHTHHIRYTSVCNTYVYHIGHYQRHKQLKAGLQHFKQRSQYALFFVGTHVTEQSLHNAFLL